jgi:hypothetical protein
VDETHVDTESVDLFAVQLAAVRENLEALHFRLCQLESWVVTVQVERGDLAADPDCE